jgi:hypothetical protein
MEPFIKPDMKLIEMGVGSGFCSNYLKSRGYNIRTIDIDKSKNPNIVCDLKDWNPKEQIHGFMSFQVFEHVPFPVFEEFVEKLAGLHIPYLFISVPYNHMSKKRILRINYRIRWRKEKHLRFSWPPFLPVKVRSKFHMWELKDKNTPLSKYYHVFKKNHYNSILSERLYQAQYDVFKLEV